MDCTVHICNSSRSTLPHTPHSLRQAQASSLSPGGAPAAAALGTLLTLFMHAQPAAARWLLRQMCRSALGTDGRDAAAGTPDPTTAAAVRSSWLARCLLPQQGLTGEQADSAQRSRAAFQAVCEAAVQVRSMMGEQSSPSMARECTRTPALPPRR